MRQIIRNRSVRWLACLEGRPANNNLTTPQLEESQLLVRISGLSEEFKEVRFQTWQPKSHLSRTSVSLTGLLWCWEQLISKISSRASLIPQTSDFRWSTRRHNHNFFWCYCVSFHYYDKDHFGKLYVDPSRIWFDDGLWCLDVSQAKDWQAHVTVLRSVEY